LQSALKSKVQQLCGHFASITAQRQYEGQTRAHAVMCTTLDLRFHLPPPEVATYRSFDREFGERLGSVKDASHRASFRTPYGRAEAAPRRQFSREMNFEV
jgi:hypothetical protein